MYARMFTKMIIKIKMYFVIMPKVIL